MGRTDPGPASPPQLGGVRPAPSCPTRFVSEGVRQLSDIRSSRAVFEFSHEALATKGGRDPSPQRRTDRGCPSISTVAPWLTTHPKKGDAFFPPAKRLPPTETITAPDSRSSSCGVSWSLGFSPILSWPGRSRPFPPYRNAWSNRSAPRANSALNSLPRWKRRTPPVAVPSS